jgi:branched-chain amino acid transport system ATP-binding protein
LATPDPVLSVRGLHAGYGNKEILRGVEFSVARGETVALLGANGSGKSTCLNTVSGFVRPSAGEIVLDGQQLAGLPVHRVFQHGVVQVSQARDLFPDLSVEDNLELGAMRRGAEQAQATLQEVFGIFPRLAERRSQRARTLSGGEQQMVAVGRALMSRPLLLLLDEPSGGLSPQFVDEIAQTMRRLKALGTTMLIVEQNLGLALKVADRFIVLRDGLVVDGGSVSNLEGSYEDIVRAIYL